MDRWGEGAIRVLHVDDEPGVVETTAALLEKRDDRFDVVPETDGEAALDRLDEGNFDCVISDYEMPRIDGLELLGAVREHFGELPFVLFTGKGSEEIAAEAISLGATDYLQKGVGGDQYDVLVNRVRNAVEARRARAQVERGHRAMDAAWDGIATLDEDGTFTYVNPAYAETFECALEDLVGEHWETVYPEAGADIVREEILPTVRDAGTWTGEGTLLRADGEEFVGEHTVADLGDDGFACVVRDRSERDEVDRALRHEQERFRLLVEAVEEYAMFMLDPDGHVVSWNAGAERIKGYSGEEVLGAHFSTFYTESDRETGLPDRLLERAVEEGSITDEGERVRNDGSTFWADVTITALREDGDLRGFAKVTKNVSDRKEREQRRERNERYRRRLYECTTDPDRAFEDKLVDVLELGVEYLGVEHGHVVVIDPEDERHEIVAVNGEHPTVTAGGETDLGETYCRKTIERDGLLTVYNATEQGWESDPAYEVFGLGCYLGAKLEVDGELFGTTCFVDREPRSEPFAPDEKTFVELLTRWLTQELGRRRGRIEWPIAPPRLSDGDDTSGDT